MSLSHAVRVTLPYADCSGVISIWASRCASAVVYQHDADEEVSKTHVHIGLGGCEVKEEALKRLWKNAPGKGNEFWSWKPWDGETKYLTYMTKGVLQPVFVKNISEDLLEKSRQEWAEPVKAATTGDQSEFIIRKICDSINVKRYTNTIDDVIEIGTLFNEVRKLTFKMLWAQHRRVPHTSHYKIVAGTVFLRLAESVNMFDEAACLLRSEWY